MQDPNQTTTQLSIVIQNNNDSLEKCSRMQSRLKALADTVKISEEDLDFIYDYIKHIYKDNNHKIDRKIFDSLLSNLSRFKYTFPQIYLISAHYSNLCFIQTKNESFRWIAFICFKHYELTKAELLDDLTRNFYVNLQQWFEQTQRISHAKLDDRPSLFKDKNYGTSRSTMKNFAQYSGLLILPNDILIIIMSILPLKDLSALCKAHTRFYQLFHNIRLWDKLEHISFMTEQDYLYYCGKNSNFYRYNSRQRIRDFCAKLLPYTKVEFTLHDRPSMEKLVRYKFLTICLLSAICSLGYGIYSIYPSWTDKDKSILSKIGDTLFMLMLASICACLLGGFIGSISFGLTICTDLIFRKLKAMPHDLQINDRNNRFEKFRITQLQCINDAKDDIEAQVTPLDNPYKSIGNTI